MKFIYWSPMISSLILIKGVNDIPYIFICCIIKLFFKLFLWFPYNLFLSLLTLLVYFYFSCFLLFFCLSFNNFLLCLYLLLWIFDMFFYKFFLQVIGNHFLLFLRLFSLFLIFTILFLFVTLKLLFLFIIFFIWLIEGISCLSFNLK